MKIAISSPELLLEVRCIKAPLEALGVLGGDFCLESPLSRGILALLCSSKAASPKAAKFLFLQNTANIKIIHWLQCPAAIIQVDHLEGHFCNKCLL